MNENFVRAVEIDWSRVAEESYLRGIGALNQVERVEFTAPVTFFVGENGSGNPRFWKRWRLRADSIPRAERGIIAFRHLIRIRN